MALDLEDIGMCLNKSLDNNIHMAEKTTQTETFPVSSSLVRPSTVQQSIITVCYQDMTPNGTGACNHPSMSCQELLDLSKGYTSPLSSQILFDFTKYKYCSTYNLAEGRKQVLKD